MTKQASIAYISELMENPSQIGEADHSSIAGFRQSFPYFVPARYLEAYHRHKAAPWSPAMLSAVMPYTGNWVLFCDFLNSDTGNYFHSNKREKSKSSGADARPILKAQKVITEQKEVAPVPEVEEQPAVVATIATEEPVPAVVQEPAPMPEQIVAALPTEVEPMPEVAVEEAVTVMPDDVEEDVTSEIQEQEAEIIAEQEIIEELMGMAANAEKNKEEEQAEEEINVVLQTDPPQVLPVENSMELDNEAIEELENRHNDFWTQGEDDTEQVEEKEPAAPAPPKSVVNVGVHEVIEDIDEVDDMPQYIPSHNERPLIYPMYTEDYFLTQGEKVSPDMPDEIESLKPVTDATSLMVMMSFSEWLLHFKSTTERQKEENKDQKALKTMWQKEKLAAAIEEENEEIPENVFEMAVNSITKEDGLASEALADIYVKQGKYDKAVDMYRKLSLRNPQKNAYFARKIEDILKEKQS